MDGLGHLHSLADRRHIVALIHSARYPGEMWCSDQVGLHHNVPGHLCVWQATYLLCSIFFISFSLTLPQIPEPSAKLTAFLDSSWNSLQDFKTSENRIYGPYHGKVLCVTVKLRPGQRFQTVDDGAACSLLPLGESQDLVFHLHQVTPHLNQHLWQLGQVKKLTVRRRVITQTHTQPLKSLGSLTHCCIDLH